MVRFQHATGERVSPSLHTDDAAGAAARRERAAAFTVGHDVFFAPGRFSPNTASGRLLLLHEITHVVQQGKPATSAPASAEAAEAEADRVAAAIEAGQTPPQITARAATGVQRQDEDEDSPDLPATDQPSRDPDDVTVVDRPPIMTVRVDQSEPDRVIVPGSATRAEISLRLFGDADHQRSFDPVPSTATHSVDGIPEQALEVRSMAGLRQDVADQSRVALETALTPDVDWTVSKLSERIIDDADEWNLVERCLRWSQRSHITDASGTHYFDRYLGALASRSLTSPGLFSDTTKSALDWLLIETGEKAEQIRKAIELRSSRYTTGYTVTDSRPHYAPGDVVGRFYWSTGSGMQLRIAAVLADEPTQERAETTTRNAPFTGLRIVAPGTDGHFYGYAVVYPTIDPLVVPPENDVEGRFYWYSPGTVFIRAGEFRPDVPASDEASRQHRQQLLNDALAAATDGQPARVLGLDFDVLTLATLDQRVSLIEHAVDVDAGLASGSLVVRVLASTSGADFPMLERRISQGPLLNRLLAMSPDNIAMFGRLFTARALATLPYSAESLQSLTTFRMGEDADGVIYTAYGVDVEVDSTLIAPEAWDDTRTPRIGAEPARPGETPGPVRRKAIAFDVIRSEGIGSKPITERSRPFLPSELVRIEVLGPRPQVHILTALEAAGVLSATAVPMAMHRIGQMQTLLMGAQAAGGLVRAFGPTLATRLMQGGLRAGLAAVGDVAVTQAGREALRQFAYQAVLLGSMTVVEEHRSELEQTEAGRAFLAAYNVAFGVLAARDLYQVLSSGLLREVARLGVAAAAAGRAGSLALGRLSEEFEALSLAWTRLRASGETVELATAEGFKSIQPRDPARLDVLFMQARAELAGARLTRAITAAGRSTKVADRVAHSLQQIAAADAEAARDVTAVLRAAAEMPAAAVDAFLLAVERVLQARPSQVVDLTGFLRAAARSANPTAYLADVEWLVTLPGMGDDAVRILAGKASDRYAVDLAWLRTTGLTVADINRLGADPKTPWNEYRHTAQEATNLSLPLEARRTRVIFAQAKLRGAAGEMAAEEIEAGGQVVSGYRISGSQVKMGAAVIDYEVMPLDRTGMSRGLEIKAHNNRRWRELMNSWDRRTANDLTNTERKMLKSLHRITDQLTQATTARGGRAPFMGVTSELNAPTRARLEAWLAAEAPGTQLVFIDEARIQAIYKHLQTALSLQLPTL